MSNAVKNDINSSNQFGRPTLFDDILIVFDVIKLFSDLYLAKF